MGISERREREKDQLRRKIMDAARRLFLDHGIDNTSMRKIADAIEYSPTAIYQYFADKDSLLREICRQDFASLHEAESSIGEIPDPCERIWQIGMAYMRFGVAHPEQYRLMFMTKHAVDPTPEEMQRMSDPTCDAYALLEQSVRQAMQQQRFKPAYADLDLICQTLWAAVHGAVALEITMKDDKWLHLAPFEQRAKTILDVVLDGMCCPAK
jgi:AcrR family transcriptional regulator